LTGTVETIDRDGRKEATERRNGKQKREEKNVKVYIRKELTRKQIQICRTLGSDIDDYEEFCLVVCNAL
jgi:hypothetical protein